MFRALNLPPALNDKLIMPAPVSASLFEGTENAQLDPVELKIRPETCFSTTVGASNKKTLARWHVTSPQEVIEAMLGLVGGMDGDAGEPKL